MHYMGQIEVEEVSNQSDLAVGFWEGEKMVLKVVEFWFQKLVGTVEKSVQKFYRLGQWKG